MSILKRTGTGINDVAYQDGIAAGQKVFTKDQKWSTTAAGGTYNCLHRTGSGIADVAYQNETIGKALSTYGVGSIVKVRENNSLVDFLVLSHSYPASGRTLLLRKDIHSERSMFNESVQAPNFDGSPLDSWLNSTYINTIQQIVRNQIAAVTLVAIPKYNDTFSRYPSTGTISKKIFLLSITELTGAKNLYGKPEGTQISYFSTTDKRIAYYNGTATDYWTRTPDQSGTVGAYYDIRYISKRGSGGLGSETGSKGVRPAFTLPSTILVNSSTNEVIG